MQAAIEHLDHLHVYTNHDEFVRGHLVHVPDKQA
jgi:hypothetical protein